MIEHVTVQTCLWYVIIAALADIESDINYTTFPEKWLPDNCQSSGERIIYCQVEKMLWREKMGHWVGTTFPASNMDLQTHNWVSDANIVSFVLF